MKFCCNTILTLSKQSQKSRSILSGIDFWDCFGRKMLYLITKEIWYSENKADPTDFVNTTVTANALTR